MKGEKVTISLSIVVKKVFDWKHYVKTFFINNAKHPENLQYNHGQRVVVLMMIDLIICFLFASVTGDIVSAFVIVQGLVLTIAILGGILVENEGIK